MKVVAAFALLLSPVPVLACTICNPALREQNTLGEEMDRAKLVVYGRAISSNLEGGAGKGTTEFRIDRVLRDDPFLANKKTLVLDRYVPVVDVKNPPRFVLFCDVVKDRLDAYLGRSMTSEAVIEYLEGAGAFRGKKDPKERLQALLYHSRYFDHADDIISGDAVREFAKASDQEVFAAARHLDPDRLRKMMENPKINQDYLGLLGFLLGNTGRERDANFLRGLAVRSAQNNLNGFDGLLAGYMSLKPADGWNLLRSYVHDTKQTFPVRFAGICTMRFCYALRPQEYRQEALKTLGAMLPDGDVADFAVEDLRKWKLWELTATVLTQYDKKSHDTPLIRRGIVRYALTCPTAEARQFVDRVRRQNAELVKEVEEGLTFESQP